MCMSQCDWIEWVLVLVRAQAMPLHKPYTIKIQNKIQCVSQPIREEINDITSGWVHYLMYGITTPPQSICLLLSYNPLGNMGPAIVKAVCCLDLDPCARAHGHPWTGPTSSGGSVFPLPSSHKTSSHWCNVRWGRLDSREYTSTPCIGNFSGKGPCPSSCPLKRCRLNQENWGSGSSFEPFRAWTPPGCWQGLHAPCNIYVIVKA